MVIDITDVSSANPEIHQHIESYIFSRLVGEENFIRQGRPIDANSRETLSLTSPRLDSNKDSLGAHRPISILYSLISPKTLDSTSEWLYRGTPFQVSDGKNYGLQLLMPSIHLQGSSCESVNLEYLEDMKSCKGILEEVLPNFRPPFIQGSRIRLEDVIENFDRAIKKGF